MALHHQNTFDDMDINIPALLTNATKIMVDRYDYAEWLEPIGDGDADTFDVAVRTLLGPALYKTADDTGRLDEVLGQMLYGTDFPVVYG